MKRVYIAGPITGHDDYAKKFAAVEKELKEYDVIPVNPAKAPEGLTYKEYIDRGMDLLKTCDAIYLLPGWGSSRGTRLEVTYAVTVDMPVWIIKDGLLHVIRLEA